MQAKPNFKTQSIRGVLLKCDQLPLFWLDCVSTQCSAGVVTTRAWRRITEVSCECRFDVSGLVASETHLYVLSRGVFRDMVLLYSLPRDERHQISDQAA